MNATATKLNDTLIGAGIGGDLNSNAGSITIESGTIVAKSEGDGAGIGGGHANDEAGDIYGSFQSITIKGGKVTAESASNGAGIGCGCWAKQMGTITISGGEVHAKSASPSGSSYDIGFGHRNGDYNGSITISGGVILTEDSRRRIGAQNVSKDNCIVFTGNSGQVYGNFTLKEDYTIPSGKTLIVPDSGALTIPNNVTLTNEGTISNGGDIVITGSLKNDSTIKNISDNGEIIGKVTGNQPETVYTISFLDWDPDSQTMVKKNAPVEPIQVTNGAYQWKDSWCYVSGNLTIDNRIQINGDVHLILTDACTLTAQDGINVSEDNSLTIYCQSGRSGTLSTTGGGTHAGIGSGDREKCGTITINGGIVNATGGQDGAGIGGGTAADGGIITINGGTVTAIGGHGYGYSVGGAGIGGGRDSSSGGTITINGGTVTATGCDDSAGIGGGGSDKGPAASGGNITITGGNVTAKGGGQAPGIGGGRVSRTGVFGESGSFSTGANGHAVIRTSNISDRSQESKWSGVIFENNSGKVYGSPAPKYNFEVKAEETLTIPSGTSLTVPNGVTLTYSGIIDNNYGGHLVKESSGQLVKSGSGQIIGRGAENPNCTLTVHGITLTAAAYGYSEPPIGNIIITNSGNQAATIKSVTIGGTDKSSFAIEEGSETVPLSGSSNDWKIKPQTGLSAKSYNATVTVTYSSPSGTQKTASADVSFTVNKALATVTEPTAKPLTYNGKEQELVNGGSVSGVAGCGQVQYSLTNGSGYDNAIPIGKDAKEYTVYWKVTTDENNFTYSGNTSGSVNVTIGKAASNITVDTVPAYTYGTPGGITLTANVKGSGVSGIALMSVPDPDKVKFTFANGTSLEADVKYGDDDRKDSGTATVTIPVEQVKIHLNPGSNQVTISYGGSGNLSGKDSVTTTVTVEKKTLAFNFKAQDKVYDGNNSIEGTFDDLTNQLVPGDNVEVDVYTATADNANAGQNKAVKVTVTKLTGSEAGYYTPGTATGGTVNISKAKIGHVTAPTVENPTYNGEEQALLTGGASGVPDGVTITYFVGAKDSSVEPSSSEGGWVEMASIKAKDAGTYTVWYKVAGGTNYESIEPTKIGEAEIGQKEVTLTWDGYSGLTYSGNPVNVTATADTDILGESVNVTVENGENINTGTYTATASKLTDGEGGKAGNYKLPAGVTQDYTISPAKVSFTIGNEDRTGWNWEGKGESNADPNPSGYTLGGSGIDYALSMTYDSFTHTANVAQTAGEVVKIKAGDTNGFTVTYKRIKDSSGGPVTEDEADSVRDAGTYEIWVTINPVEGNIYNYVFNGHDGIHSLKIGEITVKPYPTAVSWAHLKYVYHGHTMHPEIHVLNPFKADAVWLTSGLPQDFNHEHPEMYTGNYLVAFAETDGSDVGTYTVKAALYGKNAGNYTITDPTGSVTITPAPVTITVGDNTWVVREDGTLSRNSVTLRPAWGAVTAAPDAEEAADHQYPLAGSAITDKLQTRIEYRDPKTGEAVGSPTEPGTYEVWVEIGNTNFRHSGATDGASHNVGELVITGDPDSVKSYTVKFDPGYEGAPAGPDGMTGVFANQTVVIPPVSGENETGTKYNIARKGWSFLGWSYNGRTYKPNEEFHMPASDVTFKAEWIEAVDVSGTVKRGNDDSAPVLPGVTVTLKQGSEEVAEAVTKGDGTFTFPQVTPGVYNLEVRYHSGGTEIVKTFLVEVGADSDTPEAYLMPDKALNTVVEVAPGITAAVNMERITESQETSEIYTEDDKKTVEDGGKVEFRMSVSGGELTPEQAQEVPVPEDRIGMVLTLELTKTVTSKDNVSTGPKDIHDARVPVTTIIHLPAELQGKSSYTVYRFHDMEDEENSGTTVMQTITTSPNSDGEYLEIIRDGTAIEIHAEFYSTYVLTWQQSPGGSGSSRIELPAKPAHGKITSNPESARQGSKVTLTVTPDEGYHLGSLTVNDRNGKPVELTDNGDGTYTFTMPYGKVTVEAEFVKCGSLDFTDLDTGAWYHDYIDYVIAHGLMRGIGGGLFDPDGTVTRAQMVTVLWNLNDKPVVNYYMTYSDVAEDVWYSEAVRWATSEGIVNGYGKGKFGPNDPITREQAAVLIYRYEQKYGDGGFTGDWMYRLPFTDLDQISDWAFESVAWCNMKGVIKGKGNSVFDSKGLAKRSEMAAILMRYCRGETGEE